MRLGWVWASRSGKRYLSSILHFKLFDILSNASPPSLWVDLGRHLNASKVGRSDLIVHQRMRLRGQNYTLGLKRKSNTFLNSSSPTAYEIASTLTLGYVTWQIGGVCRFGFKIKFKTHFSYLLYCTPLSCLRTSTLAYIFSLLSGMWRVEGKTNWGFVPTWVPLGWEKRSRVSGMGDRMCRLRV